MIHPASLTENYLKDVCYPDHTRTTEDCVYVYLFRNPFSGLCKIGITNRPKVRKQQLQNSSGMLIQDLLILECQVDYDESPLYIEKYLHNFFKHKRAKGEWFNLDVKDIISIRNLFWQIDGEDIVDNTKKYLLRNV